MRALDFAPAEAHEIVIVRALEDPATQRLLGEVRARLLHGTVVALVAADGPRDDSRWPLLAARPMLDGVATAYVCRDRLCELPVNTPRALARQLDALTIRRDFPDSAGGGKR